MGNKKKVIGVIGALTALLGVILGSGVVLDFSSDSSINTNIDIGQIGDNIINNFITDTLGLDVEQYRTNCQSGVYDNDPAGRYCDLIGG